MNIQWVGCSPSNFMVGREGSVPEVIILHWMAGRLASCDATFQDGRRRASATYGIEDSTIHQYVKEEDTSFNCGVWEWNKKSISIEHSGGPDLPISNETYETTVQLITDICKRHNLNADCIHKHNEYSATQCPGTLDVERIRKAVVANLSISVHPDQVKVDIGGEWGVMEVQAIRSKLNDTQHGLDTALLKVIEYEGFVNKWVREWNLPVGSNIVEVEAEMTKLLTLEDTLQVYRNSIEKCAGVFDTDKALLEAHAAVRTEMEAKNKQITDLANKLAEAKTPVGYVFVGSWDFFTHRYKHFKKVVS